MPVVSIPRLNRRFSGSRCISFCKRPSILCQQLFLIWMMPPWLLARPWVIVRHTISCARRVVTSKRHNFWRRRCSCATDKLVRKRWKTNRFGTHADARFRSSSSKPARPDSCGHQWSKKQTHIVTGTSVSEGLPPCMNKELPRRSFRYVLSKPIEFLE